MHPQIIQGGMGAAGSNWRLARNGFNARPARRGLLERALAFVLARRLQTGDLDRTKCCTRSHIFPVPVPVAERSSRISFFPAANPQMPHFNPYRCPH